MHSDYVPLHLHTQFSLLDGAIRVDELIEAALKFRLPAISMTNHGNLFGAIEFYKKVSRAGLKPIIGCEVYVAPGSRLEKKSVKTAHDTSFHLILLCKDIHGYKNLTRLVSRAYSDGFYYKPRIDKDLLEQYCGGLIGLSSCLKGEISQNLAAGMVDEAREAALRYKRILGADNFYLEIQANELPEQVRVNEQLVELSRDLHIGLVGTNDCHYLRREDARAHDVLLCIQTGKTLKDQDRLKFSTDAFYFKSPDEMKRAFQDIPEAITNTKKIAEKCNLDLKFGVFHLPKFQVPDGYTPNSYLKDLAHKGLNVKLGGDVTEQYTARLRHELEIIETMGFASYFLIVWDFIHFAKGRGIPVGPGRGSAAGSLVSYCLDITEIDPLKYGLLFERFLNPERKSMPDIDVDFCMNRRSEVIDYVSERYGQDHVAQIITFGTMQARAAIRDVGRAMDIPYAEVDKVAKLIPNVANITIKEALKLEPKLKELNDTSTDVHELIEIAQRLEGLARHASTHAAGVVISPEPLTEFLPLYKAPNEDAIITQYDMEAIETLGLLKFDFLGLKTLTVIDTAEKLINQTLKESPSPPPRDSFSAKEIPLDDRKTFSLLSSAKATGIFQLESAGMRDLLLRLKPETFEDLIALVALYRPGPLGSGMLDDFIKRKRSDEPINYQLPQLEDILKETYGIILYQEQVMKITNMLANFSMADADLLQRALSKKKIGQMEKLKDTFISGAKKNKISEKKATRLFHEMANFAQYGFNKSHSAAYAMIAYRTAYLKAHYPVEFMAALLSADMDNTEKVVLYINECKEVGIEILPPDINESKQEFTAVGTSIRFGLEAVKGVGSSAIESIIATREQQRFDSFFDFCARIDSRKVNRKVIESLIKAGAFDAMGKRAQLLHSIDTALDIALKTQRERVSGQRSMFESHHTRYPGLPHVEEMSDSERLMMEKDALGFYITGHPLGKYGEYLQQLSVTPINKIQELPDRSDITICGIPIKLRKIQTKKTGDLMAYLTIEDLYGTTELIIFPDLYNKSAHLLTLDVPLIINGQIDKSDKGSKIITRSLTSIEQLQDENDALLKREPSLQSGTDTHNSGRAVRSRDGTGRIADRTFKQQASSKPKRKLMLTLTADSSPENLTSLRNLLTRHHGHDAVPVVLKVVSPEHWETEIETDQMVSPSEGMIADIEHIVGKGKVTLQ